MVWRTLWTRVLTVKIVGTWEELDQHLAATVQSLQEGQEALTQRDARLLELEASANVAAEALASARADVTVKVEQLEEAQRQAEALRDDLAGHCRAAMWHATQACCRSLPECGW